MNLPKAQKTLAAQLRPFLSGIDPNLTDAIKLGIEALNEVQRLRSYKAFHVVKLLPGETKDD